MEQLFQQLKSELTGTWKGEGFARFPTITDTAYTEVLIFRPDEYKAVIHYDQKALYKNDTPENGQTVFWDTGFILLKEEQLLWISSQSGGRQETYELESTVAPFVFNSKLINNDLKTIRSQRIIRLSGTRLDYELNMSTHQATTFQNHLKAVLLKP